MEFARLYHPDNAKAGGIERMIRAEIFKEFCDCAACLVLDRRGACDLCPEL